jgi:hypothetical protein
VHKPRELSFEERPESLSSDKRMLFLGRRLAEQLAKAQGDADAFASERDALQMEVEIPVPSPQIAFSVQSIVNPPFAKT